MSRPRQRSNQKHHQRSFLGHRGGIVAPVSAGHPPQSAISRPGAKFSSFRAGSYRQRTSLPQTFGKAEKNIWTEKFAGRRSLIWVRQVVIDSYYGAVF